MTKSPLGVVLGLIISLSAVADESRNLETASPNSPGKDSKTPVSAQVGEKIEAVDINGNWVNAVVIKVDGERRLVQYEGKSDYWNEWVKPDRYRIPGAAASAPKLPAGERVEALDFNTKWINATVLKTEGPRKFVHFDGKTDYWDQWESPERIRPFGTTDALALQHLAPAQAGTKGLSGWIVGTRIANGRYACTFYWFQADGHLFVSDTMPKGWADLDFIALQRADPPHCGTYGINGKKITIQLNGGEASTIGYGEEVLGNGIRQPVLSLNAGQRLEGGFSVDSAGSSGGVTTIASDSWYFHADGTFKRVKVVGTMTDDSKAAKDPHPAKGLANGSDVSEGRYEFSNGHLQLSGAGGQTQKLSCFIVGNPRNPNLLGIEDIQYKSNADNKAP